MMYGASTTSLGIGSGSPVSADSSIFRLFDCAEAREVGLVVRFVVAISR